MRLERRPVWCRRGASGCFFQAGDGIRVAQESRGLGDVYKRQFRRHPNGAQALFGITADIGTYGKVIGGGLPIGAMIGKSKWMDALDGGDWQFGDDSVPPSGVTYFAGTFVRCLLYTSDAADDLLCVDLG